MACLYFYILKRLPQWIVHKTTEVCLCLAYYKHHTAKVCLVQFIISSNAFERSRISERVSPNICHILSSISFFFFQGCDINHVSDSGRTALWKAAQCDYREVVLFLHHRGATVNSQTKVGASLLHEMTRQVEYCMLVKRFAITNIK